MLERVCGAGEQPCTLSPDAPPDPSGALVLRVGRAEQPAELWERLLPCEASRGTVSREHFQICQACAAGGFTLANLSRSGTVLNGRLVRREAELCPGDVVSVGADLSPAGRLPGNSGVQRPALQFRFLPARGAPPGSGAGAAAQPVACQLSCLGAALRSAAEVLELPEACRVLQGPGAPGALAAVLRVGRASQPPGFWEGLVPDEHLRSMISREHFQIQLEHGSNQAALSNLSANGTLINGALARDVVWLRQGDVVAIPSSAEAQRDGCQPVVTFSFHVHQPTQLAVSADLLFQCLSAHQLAPDVARSLRAELTLRPEPGSGSQLLRVGRAVQPMPLWEALLPDEATRNTISRNHFEVVAMPGEADRAATLSNLSSLGTLVNGACVHGQAPLRVGDTVGLGFAAGPPQGASAGGSEGGRPALQLRLAAAPDAPDAGGLLAPRQGAPTPSPHATAQLPARAPAPALAALLAHGGRLQELCEEVAALRRGAEQGAAPGGVRDRLAQLEAQLDRLQCDGIDSVSTLDLPPPEREGARQAKRDLTRRAERLHDEVDALFDSLRRRSSVASHGS